MRGSFPRAFARPPPLNSSSIRKTPPLNSSSIRKTLKHVVKDQVVKPQVVGATNLWIKSTRNQKPKGKTKTFLIGKELKTNTLLHTAAVRASGPTTKPNPKPESNPRIASAEGRVKPLARLLRCATALRVTAPLGYGSRRLV